MEPQVLLFDEVGFTNFLKGITPQLKASLPDATPVGFCELFWQAVQVVVVIADFLMRTVSIDPRKGFVGVIRIKIKASLVVSTLLQ